MSGNDCFARYLRFGCPVRLARTGRRLTASGDSGSDRLAGVFTKRALVERLVRFPCQTENDIPVACRVRVAIKECRR